MFEAARVAAEKSIEDIESYHNVLFLLPTGSTSLPEGVAWQFYHNIIYPRYVAMNELLRFQFGAQMKGNQ